MNFAIIMMTASCLAATDPVVAAPPATPVVASGYCGCPTVIASSCGCESACKPGFFERFKGMFSFKSSSCGCETKVYKSAGCSSCGEAKAHYSPAPVVINLPSESACGCASACEQPTFFEKLKARFHRSSSSCGCASSAPACSTCSSCGSASMPAAPIKPVSTVLPASSPMAEAAPAK